MANLDEIRQYILEELTPASGQKGKYICPICGSGTGVKKSAAFSIDRDGIHGKCFSCNFYGDLFDLIAKRDGVSIQEATRAAIEKYGSPVFKPAKTPEKKKENKTIEAEKRDFKAEITRFHEAIHDSAGEKYLNARGITRASIDRFLLGFDSIKQQIVIPYSKSCSYYAMRNISPNASRPHDKLAGVRAPLFNGAALYGKEPCFIVESPLCAISIMQEGGTAVALGGLNTTLLREEITSRRPTAPLLLALDNDEAKEDGSRPGQDATENLIAWLEAENIPHARANVAGAHKDPNEALQRNPEAFRKRIREFVEEFKEKKGYEDDPRRVEYAAESAAGFMDAFFDGVTESASTPPIPTGFYALDKLLEGGLYEGLYTVGAISSLGKTSFVLQLCDQIAAAGHDVLFFSLEMGRYELMAKSISRYTRIITAENDLPSGVAKTTRGILTGNRYKNYSPVEVQTIKEAADRYAKEVSSRIWFVEGIGNIGTKEIRLGVEKHIRNTFNRPVVVVDYLQILAPTDIRASDKQNTDRNVLELKRLSRDCKIPVIGISSLNRDNYTEPINTAAFKESGAIEYGSDCLIGLQYLGMEYRDGEKEQQRLQRIRELFNSNDTAARRGESIEIEVKLLKNRNGSKGTSDPLQFFPMFNLFKEHPAGMIPVDESTPFTRKRL